jgi:hypothetical protein
MPVVMTHQIEIGVPAQELYDYVTQPWLWHEWHPSSRSAKAGQRVLASGDEFVEMIEVKPLAPLPLRLLRQTRYTVTESVPFQAWEVEGRMKDGLLRIRYDLKEEDGGTLFTRMLYFELSGPTRALQSLLRSKMERISVTALDNLKRKLMDREHES